MRKFLYICLFVPSAAFCQALDMDAQLLLDIQQSQFPDTYESLLIGDKQLPIIVREATTTIGKGVAVVLAETGKGPLHHEGVAALAGQLNQYGWITFSIPAPHLSAQIEEPTQPDTAEPATDETQESQQSENAPQPAPPGYSVSDNISTQIVQKHEQQIQAVMRAAANRALDYTGFFMVISQGTSAAWLTKLYSEGKLESPDAMVTVSPYWPDRALNNQLPELLANTPMPILDVYSPWDNNWVNQTREQRQIAARKGLKLHYRQRQLLGLPLQQDQQFAYLAKEIYGWLSHMGW